jgi:hypothetical protein
MENKMKKKKAEVVRPLTKGEIKEIADDIVRVAIREQARDLEKHLLDIHTRIVELERRP